MVSAVFFFFSSRRRHTRLQGDWSSDVCSSDLSQTRLGAGNPLRMLPAGGNSTTQAGITIHNAGVSGKSRSEERRVGKEGRSRWAPYHLKKKKKNTTGKRQ